MVNKFGFKNVSLKCSSITEKHVNLSIDFVNRIYIFMVNRSLSLTIYIYIYELINSNPHEDFFEDYRSDFPYISKKNESKLKYEHMWKVG